MLFRQSPRRAPRLSASQVPIGLHSSAFSSTQRSPPSPVLSTPQPPAPNGRAAGHSTGAFGISRQASVRHGPCSGWTRPVRIGGAHSVYPGCFEPRSAGPNKVATAASGQRQGGEPCPGDFDFTGHNRRQPRGDPPALWLSSELPPGARSTGSIARRSPERRNRPLPRVHYSMSNRCRYVVTYDIADEVRLRRVHALVVARGDQLQYSVYLCDLTFREKLDLQHDLREIASAPPERR